MSTLSRAVMRSSSNVIVEAQPASHPHETLNMSTIASRLGVAQPTVRERYKELRSCALKRAQSFPWGESIGDSSLNDYLRMLIETEESLSHRGPRRRADRRVPSATAFGSSADLEATGVLDFRGGCGASTSNLTSGQATLSGTSMLPPAFLATKNRRDELTIRVKAAQARLSNTLSLTTNETEPNSGQSSDQGEHIECTGRVSQSRKRAAAELGSSKHRRTDSQPSVSSAADRLADANMTKTSSETASSTAELPSKLDDEDLAIERQLLAGISPADILAGSTHGRHASQHEVVRRNERRPQAAVEGSVHGIQSFTTQSRPSCALGPADLSDDQLRPGGEFLRSEAEVAVLKRWMA